MNGLKHDSIKHQFLDILTSMQTHRPQNLNMYMKFNVESEFKAKNS